ncbi:hypothetical protein [Aneurinibacillus aneurinilyticus]|jgi:hypothetical protein|uniref:hypothetical protein n=1 Tax=Aneurinibacillus aneurinilyticus TaxID=1391 RepID=UPI003C6C18A1
MNGRKNCASSLFVKELPDTCHLLLLIKSYENKKYGKKAKVPGSPFSFSMRLAKSKADTSSLMFTDISWFICKMLIS